MSKLHDSVAKYEATDNLKASPEGVLSCRLYPIFRQW